MCVAGAISDSSTSKYRRRKWVVWSTGFVALSLVILSYVEWIAATLVDVFGIGAGDWDPQRVQAVSTLPFLADLRERLNIEQAKNTAIGIAVTAFYLLDFALNGLQASLRNLLLDVTPSEQLNQANAWHGRMNHAGAIIGNALGAKLH